IRSFRDAIASVKLEIEAGEDKLASSLTQEVQALFGVYLMLLENDAIVVDTETLIQEGYCASYALKLVIDRHAKQFESMDDPYLRARSEDIRHLGLRIYASINAHDFNVQLPNEPFILLSKNLSIADIAEYANQNLVGLVCVDGSVLSHAAVLASALGITAIMGVGDLNWSKVEGSVAVMDGYRAQVIFNASPQMQQEYQRLAVQENRLMSGLDKLKDKPAETSDGYRINLYANTGLLADLSPGLERGAEGVGLYRSEIPFMLHETFPTEDEQTAVYRKILEAYA
ncbi:phosphoenolpyruvate-utilizing N-terminal domain-containing protein, partial [Oleiphilus sp. HI0132]|uniref:phosphoenolpyruvate-utilizing N-terminal domain-containing protein n=2 Tax=Oleiphilus sp. HI0132 TaxID=1822270 RepID=UPI000A592A91